MITLQQAKEQFADIAQNIPQDDEVMLNEAWSDYTDSLCKEGELTDLQYHYCPAYDEDMPEEDIQWILDKLGIRIQSAQIAERDDGLMSDMTARGATHWDIRIMLGDSAGMAITYSMGSAHKGRPVREDVIHCLLMDYTYESMDFDQFCDELGYCNDSIEALKTFEACQAQSKDLKEVFGEELIDKLRDLFQDY